MVVLVLGLGAYSLAARRNSGLVRENLIKNHAVVGYTERGRNIRGPSLPALDAHGFDGIQEINRLELTKLMSKLRPLSPDEKADLDRGCPGFTCLYQGLGLTRWPELARNTLAYLRVGDALKRHCPDGQENFVYVKQGWWLSGSRPTPNPTTGEVSVSSVTRVKPGWYTFNYAVYFPCTATYVWLNHRDYGFPVNLIKPQKAYLALSPPPLDPETRPAQIYCSTCR
jgi:hypothetical protein